MSEALLVFARSPEPGQCKTRLIPKLGVAGATELHRQMTRFTLDWAHELSVARGTYVEVQISGNRGLWADQFSDRKLVDVPQAAGDLGARLQAAFINQVGSADKVVVVGTDCPQLAANFVQAAYERLETHTVCIAPAVDGGYVLLGINLARCGLQPGDHEECRRIIGELFREIDWGTAAVLQQTLARVARVGVSCGLLRTLADVDLPSDLSIWEAARDRQADEKPNLSVVIPTYHEESGLGAAIDSVHSAARTEVIVVAAGRSQASLMTAGEKQVQFLESAAGRGLQLNFGAAHATADTLLFLHADTRLPADFGDLVASALTPPRVVGGAFALHIDTDQRAARWIERGVRFRSRWRQLPYGDQALFMRRSVFEQLNGFKPMPIMEDYELVCRLRKSGRLALIDRPVRTSSRRWQRLGYCRTTLVNQLMLAGYHLGIPSERLAKFYRLQPGAAARSFEAEPIARVDSN